MREAQVVVVGGGFAGIQAVRAVLRDLPSAHIQLIDAHGYATMIPALPDVLSGRVRREMLQRPLADLFAGFNQAGVGDRVSVVVDRITHVALHERAVYGSARYPYDGLIVAAGSVPSPSPIRAHTVHSLESAERFRAALQEHSASAESAGAPPRVVIVGAGYTGLEVALALRDGFGGDPRRGAGGTGRDAVGPLPITVVEAGNEILAMASDRERRRVRDYLAERGVELKLGTTTAGPAEGAAKAEQQAVGLRLSDGSEIPNALVCWAAGMRAVDVGLEEQLDHARDGRIYTNEFLQAPGHPEVMLAGDSAALTRDVAVVRRAVNFAFYSGRRAGQNLAAYLTDGSMKPFRPVDLGWIIPLGDASIGRLFGTVPVGGRFGSRLHYIMTGFRHFGGGRAGEFYRTAFRLRRRPDLPSASEASPAPGGRGVEHGSFGGGAS